MAQNVLKPCGSFSKRLNFLNLKEITCAFGRVDHIHWVRLGTVVESTLRFFVKTERVSICVFSTL